MEISTPTTLPFYVYIGVESYELSYKFKDIAEHESLFFVSLTEAKKWFYKIQALQENLPSAIICDAEFGAQSIRSFIAHICLSESIKVIPFILYSAPPLFQETRVGLYSVMGVDDIYESDFDVQKIQSRLTFLKAFKRAKLKYVAKSAESVEPVQEAWVDRILKRSLDITIALILLILLSPFFLLIAILIKLESKGPVFYMASRAGTNYQIFKFFKFRSMYVDADRRLKEMQALNQYAVNEKNPVFFKISKDPRVTKFGSFLRNTSIDELPQLLNVLKGDMSLVGNRPLPLYEAMSLTQDQWAERFLAPAGITGLWQITKRGQKEMSDKERIDLDINYANNNSFFRDLWILFKTPRALIQKEDV